MKSIKGITLAILSSATFGMIALFSIPLMKEGMHIQSILFYRFFFAALVMGGVCLYRKRSFRVPLSQIGSLLMLGTFYVGTSIFLIHSYEWIPSGVATTIHFLYPILVSLIMVLFFREKGSLLLMSTAVISLLGVVLLCWSDNGSMNIKGVMIAAMTILTYALYIVGVNQTKVGREMGAETLAFYVLFISSIICLIYALLTQGIQPISTLPALGRLSALAILATVVSNLALVIAIKYIGSTVTSILGSMEPLVAMLIGVLYFSEAFTIYTLLGVLLIIIAVSLVVRQSAKAAKPKVENVKVPVHRPTGSR